MAENYKLTHADLVEIAQILKQGTKKVKPRKVIPIDKKNEMLKALKKHLNDAWKISNTLMGAEENSHSKNGDRIYRLRDEISSAKTFASFIKFTEEL